MASPKLGRDHTEVKEWGKLKYQPLWCINLNWYISFYRHWDLEPINWRYISAPFVDIYFTLFRVKIKEGNKANQYPKIVACDGCVITASEYAELKDSTWDQEKLHLSPPTFSNWPWYPASMICLIKIKGTWSRVHSLLLRQSSLHSRKNYSTCSCSPKYYIMGIKCETYNFFFFYSEFS